MKAQRHSLAEGVGQVLKRFGRLGPALLVGSLAVGLLLPGVAAAAYWALPVSAFLLTLGALLAAGLSPVQHHPDRRLLATSLIWIAFVLPAVIGWGTWQASLAPELRAGLLLSFAAPPVGSAAAIAAMLGLQPRLALVLSLSLTLAAPVTMPLIVALGGGEAALDGGLVARLFGIVGGAALAAMALLRWRSLSRSVLPDAQAGSGVAVIGLVIVGLGTTIGVRRHLAVDPDGFLLLLVLASGLNLSACAIGAALFAGAGRANAATVGLVSGNRNVTLAWAASGSGLPSQTEAFVAACVVPILSLPLLIQSLRVVARWRRSREAAIGMALLFAGSAVHAAAVPFAACTPVRGEDRCLCSARPIETLLSFAEAADLVLLYYKYQPDEQLEELLGSLLRSRAFGWQRRAPADISVRLTPGSRAMSRLPGGS